MLLHGTDTLDAADLLARTGWELKPEGLCKDVRCVPLAAEARDGDRLALRDVAPRLGMAVVEGAEHGLIALGPEAGGPAVAPARQPHLRAPPPPRRPFPPRPPPGDA